MNLLINIPVFIFNTIMCGIATVDILKHYKKSKFPPRLSLTLLLILGGYPSSVVAIIPCIINKDILRNYSVCYAYNAINCIGLMVSYALFGLSIFTATIIASNISRRQINKFGNFMLFSFLVIFALIELVILPIAGAEQSRKYTIGGKNYHRSCLIKQGFATVLFNYTTIFTSAFSLVIGLFILFWKMKNKEFQFNTSDNRFVLTFFLFGLVNLFYNLNMIITQVLKVKLSQNSYYLISDLNRSVSGLFALCYLVFDAYARNKELDLDVKKILKSKIFRVQLKTYFMNRKNKVSYQKLLKWERFHSNLRFSEENLKETDKAKFDILEIEKDLELDLMDFLMSEVWRDFYEEYIASSQFERQLMEKLEKSNN